MSLTKVRREDVPKGANLCEYCTAKCCRYIALPIDSPSTRKDYDEIRWFLAHQDVSVFVDEGDWYLVAHRVCRHLEDDGRCGIYETRPRICRDYSTDTCEYDDDFTYEKIFENDAQLAEYTEALLGPDPLTIGLPQVVRG